MTPERRLCTRHAGLAPASAGPQHADPSRGQAEEGGWSALGPAQGEGPGEAGRGSGRAPKDSPAGRLGGHRAAAVAWRRAASGAQGPGLPGLRALGRPGARLGGKPP